MATHSYDLFGLIVASEFAIPWAPEAATPGDGDVRIRRARPGEAEDGFQFEVPGVARYRIVGGVKIIVDAGPDVSEETIRLYLLGSALGILLHQRGLLVLHANAIVIDGAAVVFMGPSGAGKSTLAAWFSARGYPVLTDDICAVEAGEDGRIEVLPGLTRLRLAADAASHLGFDTAQGDLCLTSDKREIGLPRTFDAAGAGLRACYLLSESTTGEGGPIRRVMGMDAVQMLMANTYRGVALKELGGSSRHLEACLRVAAHAPCFEAGRSKDWSRFDETAEILLAHARDIVARHQEPPRQARDARSEKQPN